MIKNKIFPRLVSVILLFPALALACGAPKQSQDIADSVAATQTAIAVQSMSATLQVLANQQSAVSVDLPVSTSPPISDADTPPVMSESPEGPYLVATMDVNCRFGPDKVYDQLDYLASGEKANIEGKDKYGNWWLITTPRKSIKCWVWNGAVTVNGDTSGIPVITPPPTPTLKVQGSISGYAFLDVNFNDVFDGKPTDGVLSGAIFFLRKGACSGGEILQTVETDSNGLFKFKDVPAGDYCVQHSPDQETLYPAEQNVKVEPGQNVTNINFRREL